MVFQLETIQEDFQYLIAKLGRHDNTKELISPETITKNKNAAFYRNYFNLLDEKQLINLVNLHRQVGFIIFYNQNKNGLTPTLSVGTRKSIFESVIFKNILQTTRFKMSQTVSFKISNPDSLGVKILFL